MLILTQNTLTDQHTQNNVQPNIWAPIAQSSWHLKLIIPPSITQLMCVHGNKTELPSIMHVGAMISWLHAPAHAVPLA